MDPLFEYARFRFNSLVQSSTLTISKKFDFQKLFCSVKKECMSSDPYLPVTNSDPDWFEVPPKGLCSD